MDIYLRAPLGEVLLKAFTVSYIKVEMSRGVVVLGAHQENQLTVAFGLFFPWFFSLANLHGSLPTLFCI